VFGIYSFEDFLANFPRIKSKYRLQRIISLVKSHTEAKNTALSKLQRATEDENYDPLEHF